MSGSPSTGGASTITVWKRVESSARRSTIARALSSSEGALGSALTASTIRRVSGTATSASSSFASPSSTSARPTGPAGNAFCTRGVRRSASTRQTEFSRSSPNESARFTAVVVFPSPGRVEETTIVRRSRVRRSDWMRARSVRYSSEYGEPLLAGRATSSACECAVTRGAFGLRRKLQLRRRGAGSAAAAACETAVGSSATGTSSVSAPRRACSAR